MLCFEAFWPFRVISKHLSVGTSELVWRVFQHNQSIWLANFISAREEKQKQQTQTNGWSQEGTHKGLVSVLTDPYDAFHKPDLGIRKSFWVVSGSSVKSQHSCCSVLTKPCISRALQTPSTCKVDLLSQRCRTHVLTVSQLQYLRCAQVQLSGPATGDTRWCKSPFPLLLLLWCQLGAALALFTRWFQTAWPAEHSVIICHNLCGVSLTPWARISLKYLDKAKQTGNRFSQCIATPHGLN